MSGTNPRIPCRLAAVIPCLLIVGAAACSDAPVVRVRGELDRKEWTLRLCSSGERVKVVMPSTVAGRYYEVERGLGLSESEPAVFEFDVSDLPTPSSGPKTVGVMRIVSAARGHCDDTAAPLDSHLGAPPVLTPSSDEAEERDQPVTREDLQILEKASDLLKTDAAWNRSDDRECTDDEATGRRSLFCVLQKACIDVLGTYDHRRVALQEVRFAVEEATRGQELEHRLRDFNNLPTTTLTDIRRVLDVATGRVRARLEQKRVSSPAN